MSLTDRLLDDIRRSGPLTVAAFMERALYDPRDGYYTSSAQRSGRDGDFYTSVDAGPLFGQLLAELVFRLWALERPATFDLVEAGAGNGRLTRDILDALGTEHPECHACLRVTLVERSVPAREQHAAQLAAHRDCMLRSVPELPTAFDGLLVANELLDAMPAHRVTMTSAGLREVYVGERSGQLGLEVGPLSDPELEAYFVRAGVVLPPGAVADVSPAAVAWAATAARSLTRGALLLVDYGYPAAELFSAHHPDGTLVSYARHRVDAPGAGADTSRRPAWLLSPGERDLTTHVDFTSVARAAEGHGARQQCLLDQTRFLLGLGLVERFATAGGSGVGDVRWRLAAKSLVGPQGLGGSHKALLLTKGVPAGAALLQQP